MPACVLYEHLRNQVVSKETVYTRVRLHPVEVAWVHPYPKPSPFGDYQASLAALPFLELSGRVDLGAVPKDLAVSMAKSFGGRPVARTFASEMRQSPSKNSLKIDPF